MRVQAWGRDFRRRFCSGFLWSHQCFKDHLLKWIFHLKLDFLKKKKLKDKHYQGEVKRGQRGHSSEAERKRVRPDSTEGEQVVRKIWRNGKGLELSNGWWMQFHEIRQKLVLSKTNKCTRCLSGGKWGWQADLSRQPLSSTRVLHTWDDFTHTTWGSTHWHPVPLKHTPSDPPSHFICTLSFTSLSGMVSGCLQTVFNYSQFVKNKYHLCPYIWGRCVKVTWRMFSALIWWSYRDRSPCTLLSTAGMAVRSGLVPGSKWTIKSAF